MLESGRLVVLAVHPDLGAVEARALLQRDISDSIQKQFDRFVRIRCNTDPLSVCQQGHDGVSAGVSFAASRRPLNTKSALIQTPNNVNYLREKRLVRFCNDRLPINLITYIRSATFEKLGDGRWQRLSGTIPGHKLKDRLANSRNSGQVFFHYIHSRRRHYLSCSESDLSSFNIQLLPSSLKS